MWKSPAFVFAFAGVVLLVSLPEVPSQIRALAEALGVTGAEWHWWNYAGVLLALFLMLLSSYPAWKWVTKNARIRIEPPPSPRDIILLITIAVAFVGIVALFLTTDWSKPIYVWKHPKLTLDEQIQVKAKCRIAAYDAIGAGRGGLRDPTSVARSNYVRDCLTIKGFTFIEVRESDGQS